MAVFISLICGVFQTLVFCFIVVFNIFIALFMLLSTGLMYCETHILSLSACIAHGDRIARSMGFIRLGACLRNADAQLESETSC
jgi:hypothetical protein